MDLTFKGTTFSSLGGVIEKMEWLKIPGHRKNKIYIPGRDGLHELYDDGLESMTLNCVIVWTDPTKFSSIPALLSGSGILIYDQDPTHYRNASVEDRIEPTQIALWQKMSIPFFIEKSFRYLITDPSVVKSSFPATYVNAGTIESKPLLKVTGTGTVVFVVNGVSMTYVFDTAYVYIDCDAQSVYYAVADDKNRIMTIAGDYWPVLAVGSNTITKTSGTLTSIEITPRTRFI